MAKPFIRVFTASLFPLMVFLTFKQFAEGLSSTRPAMIIALAACAVNIGLNYLLIFGNFGFPKMGLQGAAWATFSARCLMAAAMFAYVWYKPAYRMYRFGLNFIGIKWEYCSRILTIGFPVCLQFLFEFGTFAAAAVMAGRFGAGELAAHQIALNLAALTYMAGSGFSAAAAVRVGNYLGRADYRNLALAGKAGFILVGGFMGLCAAAFIGLHNLLPTFYVTDVSVINLAAELLIIAAFFQLSDGIQVVGQGVLRGMGDVRIPTAINLVAFWAFGLPLGYWLGVNLHLRVQGIWYGLLAGLTVAAVLLFFRFLVLTRRARIHIPAFDAAERERQG